MRTGGLNVDDAEGRRDRALAGICSTWPSPMRKPATGVSISAQPWSSSR